MGPYGQPCAHPGTGAVLEKSWDPLGGEAGAAGGGSCAPMPRLTPAPAPRGGHSWDRSCSLWPPGTHPAGHGGPLGSGDPPPSSLQGLQRFSLRFLTAFIPSHPVPAANQPRSSYVPPGPAGTLPPRTGTLKRCRARGRRARGNPPPTTHPPHPSTHPQTRGDSANWDQNEEQSVARPSPVCIRRW